MKTVRWFGVGAVLLTLAVGCNNPPGGKPKGGTTGVTKATGLAEVARYLGVDAADVVAFGDMPNDLPMLAWAGLAYAVEGAHPEVLAAVPGRVLPPEKDGVGRELERLFGL